LEMHRPYASWGRSVYAIIPNKFAVILDSGISGTHTHTHTHTHAHIYKMPFFSICVFKYMPLREISTLQENDRAHERVDAPFVTASLIAFVSLIDHAYC